MEFRGINYRGFHTSHAKILFFIVIVEYTWNL